MIDPLDERLQAQFVVCPFCRATDFDLPGLKSHLLNRECEVMESVEDIQRVRF